MLLVGVRLLVADGARVQCVYSTVVEKVCVMVQEAEKVIEKERDFDRLVVCVASIVKVWVSDCVPV